MSEIESKVVDLLSELCKIPASELDGSTSIDSLGLDSVDNLEVMMKIEDAFRIELDTAQFSLCTHVKDVIEEIDRIIKHRP